MKTSKLGPKIGSAVRFYERFKSKFGSNLTFEISDYKGMQAAMPFKCTKHPEDDPMYFVPKYILNVKKPCPKCREIYIIKRSEKSFMKKVEKFGDRFDYSEMNLKDLKERKQIYIICKLHGGFLILPRTHYESKYGCIACKKYFTGINKNKPKFPMSTLIGCNPLIKWKRYSDVPVRYSNRYNS